MTLVAAFDLGGAMMRKVSTRVVLPEAGQRRMSLVTLVQASP